MQEGYDVNRLNEGFRSLIADLSLDVLILDTHPGINEETLLSIAMSNTLVIVLRPDQQDYEGTQVTVAVARKLGVPRMMLVVNKAPDVFDPDAIRARVEETYQCPVAAVLPHSDDLMVLASEGVFVLRHPDHPLTGLYRDVAAHLRG
jgi:MinD-like ATPase involved in chromosome partitioning or flagellar assembly